MKSLPLRTKVLIVGAGPVGLTHALALLKQGLDPTDSDIIIVDKLPEAQNSSRAFAVHAATLEVCPFRPPIHISPRTDGVEV